MLNAGDPVDDKIIQVQNLRKTYEVDSLIAEEFEAIDQQLILLTDSLQREENVDSNLTLTLEVKRDSYRQKMFKVNAVCLFFFCSKHHSVVTSKFIIHTSKTQRKVFLPFWFVSSLIDQHSLFDLLRFFLVLKIL